MVRARKKNDRVVSSVALQYSSSDQQCSSRTGPSGRLGLTKTAPADDTTTNAADAGLAAGPELVQRAGHRGGKQLHLGVHRFGGGDGAGDVKDANAADHGGCHARVVQHVRLEQPQPLPGAVQRRAVWMESYQACPRSGSNPDLRPPKSNT